MLPEKYSSTLPALFGLSAPEGLADGAANGTPASRSSFSVIGWSGQRRPTVSPPASTTGGTISRALSTIVSGPGQKLSARTAACGGTSRQYFSMLCASGTISDSGFCCGRPLIS